MEQIYKQLKEFGRVRLNEPLAKHTTFKIGGSADFFIEVKDNDKLIKLLSFLSSEGIEYFILGGGSNILFSDERFEGAVVKLQNADCRLQNNDIVVASAGTLLSQVVDLVAKNNLSGIEWGIGIPGTIGGAVRGNAGAFGKNTSDSIEKVEICRDGEVLELSNKECGFNYRESDFKHNKDVVLRAWFKLVAGDKKAIAKAMQEYLKLRTGRYPTYPNAGSFFKNVKLEKWSNNISDLPEVFRERGSIPAGWLVEQSGMKGFAIGGAKVSDEHGNFIVNFNKAAQSDVLQVVEAVKEKVYNKFEVELEPEVEIVS